MRQLRDAVVEDDPNWLLVAREGVYREVDVSVSEEDFRQMWEGYMCAWCYEPWPERWPERCTLPGCWSERISEQAQRAYLEERFGGEKRLGPSKETIERWQERQIWTP